MLRVVLIIATVLYPFVVYFGVNHVPPGVLAGLLAVLFVARALTLGNSPLATTAQDDEIRAMRATRLTVWLTATLVICVALWAWVSNAAFALRVYPLITNLLMLVLFSHSLFYPPPLIERIAMQRKMPVSDYNRGYLRCLTQVWVGFFCVNSVITAWTIWFASMQIWLLYNGFIVYVTIGVLFGGEIIYRQIWQARFPESESS